MPKDMLVAVHWMAKVAQGKRRTSQGQIYAPGGSGHGGLPRLSTSCDIQYTAQHICVGCNIVRGTYRVEGAHEVVGGMT